MLFTESLVEQAALARFAPGTAGIPTAILTKCRNTARRPPCGAESRQESRRHGGIRGWRIQMAPGEPGAEHADDAQMGLEVRVGPLP